MDTATAIRSHDRRREPADRARPRTHAGPVFASAVCVVDTSALGQAARHQAAAFADPGGAVHYISAPGPTRRRSSALLDRCVGADLLVLGAAADAPTVLEHACIPVLLARCCPLGAKVTDRILVAVDDCAEPDRAAEVAGLLAARHDGTVAIAPVPERNPALQRATAASSRIIIQATGVAPRVVGEYVAPERAISSVAATLDATLLVLPAGSTEQARSKAALIARWVGCSVLAVPVLTPAPEALTIERPPTKRRMA
jgi:hypothetical protein